MDSNDSLKHLLRCTRSDDPNITGCSNEHKDTHTVPRDYYVSRENFNMYTCELVEEAKKLEVGVSPLHSHPYFKYLPLSRIWTTIHVLNNEKI